MDSRQYRLHEPASAECCICYTRMLLNLSCEMYCYHMHGV